MSSPGRPSHFDIATGRDLTGPEAGPQAEALVARLAMAAEIYPQWRIDSGPAAGRIVEVSLRDPLASDQVRIILGSDGAVITVSVTAEPSGWVRLAVERDGVEIARAHADRPYEEIELLPPDLEDAADPPGRIGKRIDWIMLSAAAWPILGALAGPDGFVVAAVVEA
ncbi:hypothetical protein [Prosthecodimorpha staleyi]|uniref:Uncharacterized protein n=1 Tax=Prosthecodimorpha staleyi TaxID=2840188 RepID=A0A947D8R0_9HYPH|nr:hypothetical protein [Prosthecodimorpha staleyi]MBT9290277.1 hypothetical protein [Prosthecodimorpha staleyi]